LGAQDVGGPTRQCNRVHYAPKNGQVNHEIHWSNAMSTLVIIIGETDFCFSYRSKMGSANFLPPLVNPGAGLLQEREILGLDRVLSL